MSYMQDDNSRNQTWIFCLTTVLTLSYPLSQILFLAMQISFSSYI